MSKEGDNVRLNTDIIKGNIGMMIEHLADADLTPLEIKILLATAIRSRARVKMQEADAIDDSYGDTGHSGEKSIFERKRAENLRKLARQILKF